MTIDGHSTLEIVRRRIGLAVFVPACNRRQVKGADKAFIGDYATLDVEADRKLPLVTTNDIVSGEVHWLGQGVVNPFADSGGLVNLREYPRLRAFLEARREIIAKRHCAKKVPANWYRTIDRITPALGTTPKLLIPAIKGEAHVVHERGEL